MLFYRDNPEIVRSVERLQRFCVPQFMLNKMKDFIKNVQGNSYALGTFSRERESRQALILDNRHVLAQIA